eukprot:GHVR01111629.1.p1 GENE.GHVR01111629.1~~GHVR01111629.1.p1  ORF type:complete len:154 (-),score=61.21 GHVR01111629.1:14-475(-)
MKDELIYNHTNNTHTYTHTHVHTHTNTPALDLNSITPSQPQTYTHTHIHQTETSVDAIDHTHIDHSHTHQVIARPSGVIVTGGTCERSECVAVNVCVCVCPTTPASSTCIIDSNINKSYEPQQLSSNGCTSKEFRSSRKKHYDTIEIFIYNIL